MSNYDIAKSDLTGNYYFVLNGKKYGITQWMETHDAKVRADAIDEMILDITSRMTLLKMYADEDDRRGDTYTEHYHSGGIWELSIIRDRLEQIKEQENEQLQNG